LSWGQMMKEEADAFKKKTGEKGIGDVSEAVFKLLASPVSIGFVAALDQSFLTGISDLIELKEARDLPKAGAGIARNIISRMLVPGVARDIQKLMVDEKLEGDLYITNMLKEFPGSSAFLDKDLNYFGDPARYNSIMQENGFTRRAFSLIGRITSTEKPDQAFEILYRNGITPPNWSQSMSWIDKTPMTKSEQREFIASAGPSMKEFIIRNEEILNQMDTETAQKYIADSFSAIRGNAKKVMQKVKEGKADYHFIEIMACPGGCLGGGGQPIPTNLEIRTKRKEAIYEEDMGMPIRKSHENPEVDLIYKEFLEKPLGHKSHELLHTYYTPRKRY